MPLIVISNRLPVTLVPSHEPGGVGDFVRSSGGLASALAVLHNTQPFTWVGWLGSEVASARQAETAVKLLEHGLAPCFLSASTAVGYYDGFSNSVLWPALHGLEVDAGSAGGAAFSSYVAANHAFARAALAAAAASPASSLPPTFFVHDYHLCLVPALIKAALPNARVGFFLHVSFEEAAFVALPQRAELLRGLLAADLVAFHTHGYAREFEATVARCLPGARVLPTRILSAAGARATRILALPIGIDPAAFAATAASAECRARLAELRARFAGARVVLSVDRMDVIKGIPHRLLAAGEFLAAAAAAAPPLSGERVVFLQVSVPSREAVAAVKELIASTHALVGLLGARFGGEAVAYVYGSVSPVDLAALYVLADVLLVTSLRDGMNLVALEFVAAQAGEREPGVLVLSENAGCAESLAGAILVNPFSPPDVARGLREALALTADERKRRWRRNHDVVERNTAEAWGRSFLEALEDDSGGGEGSGGQGGGGKGGGGA